MTTNGPTTTPRYWGWFAWQEWDVFEPGDTMAYAYPDYGGPREGDGLYVDLYVDPLMTTAIGRLWVADHDRLGLLHLPNEDDVMYAKVALTARRMHAQNIPADVAFQDITGQYTAGPVFEGPLDDIADPDLTENEGI